MSKSYMGMEPRVRGLIAAHLGLDPGTLTPDTDLQLDTMARRGVAQLLERSFAIVLDEASLARLRSCRDLSLLVSRQLTAGAPPGPEPPTVWVRVIPGDPKAAPLERLVKLTPYMMETIIEDARVSGRCGRLEVILDPAVRPSPEVSRLLQAARVAGLSVEMLESAAPHAARRPGGSRRKRSPS